MTANPPTAAFSQAQFLRVLSREEANKAFRDALQPRPLGAEIVPLDNLVGRVLAEDVAAAIDTPPFDRSTVDGFAIRAADVESASAAAPVTLDINAETIACGTAPRLAVAAGTATPIATGGPIPRGADAVVMIEHTDLVDGRIEVTRSVAPGGNIAFAGSDIARGQTLLRRGIVLGAPEIGMLAAVGHASAPVWRRPSVAVLSTGDELTEPGRPLAPAAIYDSNGPIIAAALIENGCDPVRLGAVGDDEAALEAAIRRAFEAHDALILSGGTSKGAGDLTTRIVATLGAPGIVAHGVALKPGKPLCLAVCNGKPVVVLPGFPTSAMFTFHDIVAPVLRELAGLPRRTEASVAATLSVRVPSELGRTEFVMVALAAAGDRHIAHPVSKGSGAVTAFSLADGFVRVDALDDSLAAGTEVAVTLFAAGARAPDVTIVGSHCVGLDAVVGRLVERGISARVLATGSLGGLAALKRGECDIAPIHLLDPASDAYNAPFLGPDMRLVPGWRRAQGIVFRRGDARFEGKSPDEATAEALADPHCVMVNRNAGSGTRLLVDRLLHGAKPPGYWNQPSSHNAVAVAVAQGRADWGVAIRQVADALGLGFLPLADEHYDFAVPNSPRSLQHLAAFQAALRESGPALLALGFRPVETSE